MTLRLPMQNYQKGAYRRRHRLIIIIISSTATEQQTLDDVRAEIDAGVVVTQQLLQFVTVLLVTSLDDAFYLTTATINSR